MSFTSINRGETFDADEAGQAGTTGALVEAAQVEDALVDDVPVQDTRVGNAPVDGALVAGARVSGALVEDAQVAVAASDVTKVFGTGESQVHALRGMSFCVGFGSMVSVIGRSGSGKSTLLNILGLLDSPTSGDITIAGVSTRALSASQKAVVRNEMIGFVFQQFYLQEYLTAWENVTLPLMYRGVRAKERKIRALAALEQVGLTKQQAMRTPSLLSGGQQQRIAIARALVGDPPVLLCDEPTGNLDSATGNGIMELFETLPSQNRTVLIITHDSSIAERTERTITIRDGEIVADVW